VRPSLLLLGLALAGGCQPNTSRPGFVAVPEAAGIEVRLAPREAARLLAEGLKASGIPIQKVMLRDAYLESGWFYSKDGRPAQRQPIGQGIVRVRGWADPARVGSSQLWVETVYRPLADPSLPERELDRQVPPGHPTALRVTQVLKQLVDRYGGAPAAASETPAPAADSDQP